MNLATKLAGIFASGMFLLVIYTAFFHVIDPGFYLNQAMHGNPQLLSPFKLLEIIAWAFAGAGVSGFLGHRIGYILSHPKGKKKQVSTPQSSVRPVDRHSISEANKHDAATSPVPLNNSEEVKELTQEEAKAAVEEAIRSQQQRDQENALP